MSGRHSGCGLFSFGVSRSEEVGVGFSGMGVFIADLGHCLHSNHPRGGGHPWDRREEVNRGCRRHWL